MPITIPKYKYLQPIFKSDKRPNQTNFEVMMEFFTYFLFLIEILVFAHITIKAMEYFTFEDQETIALISVGAIHLLFFLIVGIFQIMLTQYLRDNDSVSLPEFDKITTAMNTWIVEQLFFLIGTAMVTYYVIYEVQYYPAFDDMIRILLLVLAKFILITVHFSLFLKIDHQYDPTTMNSVFLEQI